MDWFEVIHSLWRYAVLAGALFALGIAVAAWAGARHWDPLAERAASIFPIVMDVQLLIGIAVWVFGDWPRGDALLSWIHPLVMTVAVGLAHAGKVLAERASGSREKGTRASLAFGASLLLVVAAIPLNSWLV
jgi:hypothetical protein